MTKLTSDRQSIGDLAGAELAIRIAEIVRTAEHLVVVLVPDFVTAFRLERELSFFDLAIQHFPDWETLPYDNFSPHQDIISQRLATLHNLPNFKHGVLIIPVTTLMHRLCPQSYVNRSTFLLARGETVDLSQMRLKLEQCGYQYTSQVMEHGEFTVRGSILDVFPMGASFPYRIDLFDNEVDSIRQFDPETQRSTEPVEHIKLLPAKEYPFTEDAIANFRTRWRETFNGDPRNCTVYQDVSQGLKAAGLEYYLPLFFEQTATLFDYLPEQNMIVQVGNVEEASQNFWRQIQERYDQYGHDITRPILNPIDLFIPSDEIFRLCKKSSQIKCKLQSAQGLPDLTHVQEFVAQNNFKILFCAESSGRRLILEELLFKQNLKPVHINHWDEFASSAHRCSITVAQFEEGALLSEENIAVITEHELLGRRVIQQRHRRSKNIEADASIRNLAEITEGSAVVHIEYGVGRYRGLTLLKLNDQEGEFVTLEYANNDKLYVPVTSLHLISRYSGQDLEHAPLHSLGNDKWQREKRKAIMQVRDVAAELLQVYAQRKARKGFAFTPPDDLYYKFVAKFPFEETVDQQNAIESVIKDLTSEQPMDRVVCGDVGFGKTEVAMRAAYLAAQNGKQVAVLVPTTLLAQQHYETFVDRFAEFPVVVDVISRFRTHKEQQQILEKLADKKCDIVIGTHKLLQADIRFKDLGLLIIDEEHRFGVRQKEKIKSLRTSVHILTLTATPIPRTLNMSMSGIRDLSIISTPPAKRLSVKTFVREKSKALVQEAVNRELSRGGQVYYLHNEVETIQAIAAELTEWLPNARIAIAHGQMPERQLEHVMSDFYHRRFNVLVCTTIIETGIDIPTANTIILERADRLGLAQLHQLRGRVGRSHHQAYAFCLTPSERAMTKDAVKRLQALESLDTLGAGFILATHDLEIRGAGELLGEEQSGNIQTIGFSLFMEYLDQTIKKIQSGEELGDDLPIANMIEIDLQIPTLIPENYLGDVHTRLTLYKRIASAKSKADLDELRVEMVDRFGEFPWQTQNLFTVTEIKLLALPFGIKNIKVASKGGKIEFAAQPKVNPDKIVQLIKSNPACYSFAGPTSIKFSADLEQHDKRCEFVRKLLENLG